MKAKVNKKATAKQIALKIEELTKWLHEETAPCGSNPLFYIEIAKALLKTDMWTSHKLVDVLNMAMVMKKVADHQPMLSTNDRFSKQ